MASDRNGVKFEFDDPAKYRREAYRSGAVSADEVLKEYSRLRQVALKRLKRMEGTKYEQSQTYLRNVGMYPSIPEIKEKKMANASGLDKEASEKLLALHVSRRLDDLERFLSAKTGSIRGMQHLENELVQTLRDRGLSFVNKGNIQKFGDFMEHFRTLKLGKIYSSERVAELFGTAVKKGIDPDQLHKDFTFWLENQEELENTPKIKNAKNRNAEAYRKKLAQ